MRGTEFKRWIFSNVYMWQCKIPPRVAFLMWMVLLDRSLTKVNLSNRYIIIEDKRCVLRGEDEEIGDHLFFSCKFANDTWKKNGIIFVALG